MTKNVLGEVTLGTFINTNGKIEPYFLVETNPILPDNDVVIHFDLFDITKQDEKYYLSIASLDDNKTEEFIKTLEESSSSSSLGDYFNSLEVPVAHLEIPEELIPVYFALANADPDLKIMIVDKSSIDTTPSGEASLSIIAKVSFPSLDPEEPKGVSESTFSYILFNHLINSAEEFIPLKYFSDVNEEDVIYKNLQSKAFKIIFNLTRGNVFNGWDFLENEIEEARKNDNLSSLLSSLRLAYLRSTPEARSQTNDFSESISEEEDSIFEGIVKFNDLTEGMVIDDNSEDLKLYPNEIIGDESNITNPFADTVPHFILLFDYLESIKSPELDLLKYDFFKKGLVEELIDDNEDNVVNMIKAHALKIAARALKVEETMNKNIVAIIISYLNFDDEFFPWEMDPLSDLFIEGNREAISELVNVNKFSDYSFLILMELREVMMGEYDWDEDNYQNRISSLGSPIQKNTENILSFLLSFDDLNYDTVETFFQSNFDLNNKSVLDDVNSSISELVLLMAKYYAKEMVSYNTEDEKYQDYVESSRIKEFFIEMSFTFTRKII